jgi:hypothetical protein
MGCYRLATPADNPALCAMLRDNPMSGSVSLCLERAPDYFSASKLFGKDACVIAETAAGRPVGMYGCALWESYVNGVPRCSAYLHGLRVNAAFRHRLRWLRDGYASIPRLVPGWDKAACCFTSLASDNHAARRLLESSVNGLPHYQAQGEMVTLILPARQGRRRHVLRQARRGDIPALLALYRRYAEHWQFAPYLDEDWLLNLTPEHGLALDDFWLLEENGALRFCAALWDQRHCKQTVVRGYRGALHWLRPLYNLWANAAGRIPLPPAGGRVEHVFIAFAAFDGAPELMLRCIAELLAHAAKMQASSAVLGLSAQHPLLTAIAQRFHARTYRTCIDTVHWSGDDAPVLDGRPVQPEAALL